MKKCPIIGASIDIGTNTILLLVAYWDGKHLNVLHDEARITRLGEGLHESPFFKPAAEERTLAALKEYRSLCDASGVEKITAVGTAAFRKAKNASKFVERVERETKIKIQIISGEEEARLSYLSVERDFGETHKDLVALDIGGGSTEIISRDGGVSLPLGAVVLTESIVRHDPVMEDEFRSMKNEIDRIVGAGFPRPGRGDRAPTLIALAGSVTTLSAIKQGLTVWDGAKVQGSTLTLSDIDRMIALFKKTTVAEKKRIPGMVAGREDTILAGTLILKKVMEALGVERTLVSDRGLRFGLFYERGLLI